MADALSVLRQFWITKKKDIEENNSQIVFGDVAWPKDTKTNYSKYGAKDGGNKDFYTLDCILFLLRNEALPHTMYVKQAAAAGVPVVPRPDRRDLLSFMKGETQSSASIDKSVPMEMPVAVKRLAEEPIDVVEKKKAKTDELASMLGSSEEQSKLMPQDSRPSDIVGCIPKDKIAEMREKRRILLRGSIKLGVEDEVRPLAQSDLDVLRDIVSRERQCRTRTTVLQSVAKRFDKNVFSILQSLRAREEGAARGRAPTGQTGQPAATGAPRAPRQLPTYSRYDQERLMRDQGTSGFNIDTKGTFHGMSLSKMAEDRGKKPTPRPAPRPAGEMRPTAEARSSGSQPQKRTSKTPIIIVPAGTTSLITMYNAQDLLQDLRFISTADKRESGAKRESDVLLQRQKEGGTVPYRVIDNPMKLAQQDWDRVVAVFVQGPAWQFKGWPWNGNPVEIFSRIKAFHLKWREMTVEANVKKWAVQVIDLERHKRHLDRASLILFWEALDKHMSKNKPYLRF